MRKNLRSKILLCILAGGVLAANTAFAAEYTEQINPATDNYGMDIKTNDGNGNYTYDFGENAELNVKDNNFAIVVNEKNKSDVNEITINTPLDIYLTNNTQIESTYGIYIDDSTGNNISGKVIDRSGGGIIKVISDKRELNEQSGTIVRGVNVLSGNDNVVKIGNATVIVDAIYDEKFFADAVGLYAQNADNEIIMNGGVIKVTADVNDGINYAKATGINALRGSKITTTTGNTDIIAMATGENSSGSTAIGVTADINNANIIIGNGDITATAFSNNYAYADGIQIYEASNLEKGNGKIEAVAKGAGTLIAHGVYMEFGNSAVVSTADLGIVDISAKTIGGSVENNNRIDSIGVRTRDNSIVNIAGGSITAKAYDSDGTTENENAFVVAVLSEGTSAVNINQGTSNDVIINGDVNSYDTGEVNLNLNTTDSELNGKVYDYSTKGTTLNLANGAKWTATGYSKVNELTMNQGNIYVETPNNTVDINISNYGGVGNILFKADDTDKEGIVNIDTGSVVFDDAEEGSFINVGIANTTINTLDIDKTEENLNVLAGKVFYDGDNDNLNGKVVIKEGLITPEASADLVFSQNGGGYVTNITGGDRVTKTMDAMQHLAETAIVAWRQEDSTLSQRLGELRNSDGGQGVWVRMSRGEFEYDGAYKNQYNFFQMGYDWASGNWHYGAAVSHNDGQTTYAQGDGENRSTSLSLYGTWLGDKGHYADIVLKQGRLSNDFDIYTEAGHTSGDYDAWGTSLSGEYGMKVALNDGWYVTPQAQLTLMRIGSEDYTTNNGIKVHQDSLESAVGRIGFELGKDIGESGSIYAKASLLHDFAGSADTYLSYKGLPNSYRQDIGDTWCEAGIGFNYKTSANSYVYADVVKTFGGDMDTPWQWNAGMRWTF